MKKFQRHLCILIVFFLILAAGCDDSLKQRDYTQTSQGSQSPWTDDILHIDKGLIENGENIFYISKDGIVKYNKRQNEKRLFVESKFIDSFCISEGLVYYCENGTIIYSVDLDGKNLRIMAELSAVEDLMIEKSLAHFEVYKDFIYIKSAGTSLIRFCMSTEEAESFAEDVAEYAFLGQNFFYIDHAEKSFSIYRKNLDTKQTDLIRGDGISKRNILPENFAKYEWFDNVIVLNEKLYYTMRGPAKLFRLEPDGKDVLIEDFSIAKDAEFLTVAVNGNTLYYVLESGPLAGHLFAYDTESGDQKEIAVYGDINYTRGIRIVDNYVFYNSTVDNSIVYFRI